MSKIGKKPITIPAGVEVKISLPSQAGEGSLTVKGPKGELTRKFPSGTVFRLENSELIVEPHDSSAFRGLARALASQMVVGVTSGFQKILELNGVGYKANVKGSSVELMLGFSHPVIVEAPEGIKFSVEKNNLTVSGMDNEVVGQIAAKIRSIRPPEPYKGSGVKYKDEIIRRKAGKKAAGTTA